jgi:diguanylate cyclase (GGDEF)-like protein
MINPDIPQYTRLSFRLLRWVIFSALIAGGVLSLVQITLDAFQVKKELDYQAMQLLRIVKAPATQAIYSIDPELAKQVVDGLFMQNAIRYAAIINPDGSIFSQKIRPLITTSFRWLTDPIFKRQKRYSIPLIKGTRHPVHYGDLIITLDTAYSAGLFLDRSWIVFASGIIKAAILCLILFLVYYYLLTKPLSTLINSLLLINPSHPGRNTLPLIPSHEKDEFGLWVKTANNLLTEIEDNQQKRRAAEARILKLSQYDPLTGLPNRLMFRNYLRQTFNDAQRLRHKVALLCCGIDDFKSINEQYNYSIGDKLLQSFSERLASHNELLHTASRLGGDQFALIQYNIDSAYNAAALAEDLLNDLNKPFEIDGHSIQLYTTIGIALFPDDSQDADKLLQKAEQTMMLAKTVSRNQFQFYVASIDIEMRERKQLEKDLSSAIKQNEFYVVYQPQISYKDGRVVGAEALLRWLHPTRGLVPPDLFIPIAEVNRSIVDIGKWVLKATCQQIQQWESEGIHLKIAVNFSAVQLKDLAVEDLILSTLNEFDLKSNCLEVEITETGFMENLEQAVATLTHLQEAGISSAVDDFGTGYSSLSYLKKMPVNKLKIDKQFVRDLLIDEDDTAIVNAIIQLGKSLGYNVIAEGVETKEQEAYLKTHGCDMAQGFYYSKPVPPDEFVKFITHHNQSIEEKKSDPSDRIRA